MDSKKIKIVFAGGGTGGHIYPGIAVADATKSLAQDRGLDVEIYWIGNESGMDKDIVEKNLVSAGGSVTEFLGIPCGKLRRYLSWNNVKDVFKIISGYFKSKKILKDISPDCVFSKGGFVSVPPCRAAKSRKIPYYTHECDFTPGLATKLNSGKAKNILVSYEDTKNFFSDSLKGRCILTGNPVRPVFYEDHSQQGLDFLGIDKNHSKPILLILGGSLGALQVNNLVKENLSWLLERFIVVHQTGKRFADENPEIFENHPEDYHPYAFIYSEMPAVIQSCDLVLSRAGANSLWECAVCQKPMVLVPLCGSGTRGDQVDNAKYFEKKGAAIALVGADADAENLKKSLEKMMDPSVRQDYSKSCADLCANFKPANQIAEIILDGIKK